MSGGDYKQWYLRGLFGGWEISVVAPSTAPVTQNERSNTTVCFMSLCIHLGMLSKNMFVFPVFMFMRSNNSRHLLSVYAADTRYIWRRVHRRMLMCSGIHVYVYTLSLFEENGKSKTSRIRICWAWLYHFMAHSRDLDHEIL